jgi:hypothetical protein
MARAVLYDDDGNILQLVEGSDENVGATAEARDLATIPIPLGPLYDDFYLDTTHKVVGGAVVEN